MRSLAAVLAVILLFPIALRAEPNAFPEESPNLLIDLPKDWKPRFDGKGNMVGSSPAGNYFFKLSLAQDGDASDLAGTAVEFAKELGKSGQLKDAKVGKPESIEVKATKVAAVSLTGKDAKGDELIFRVHAFSSGRDGAYILTTGGATDADKANQPAVKKALESLKYLTNRE